MQKVCFAYAFLCVPASYLALVEVVDDFAAEILFAMPLALSRVVQKLPQRSILPQQQLPVQEQRERRLCGATRQIEDTRLGLNTQPFETFVLHIYFTLGSE